MRVADQIIQTLIEIGVEQVFGIPGSYVDPIFDALRQQDKIKLILMRHEEVGAFAASGQAKLTGKLGVCIACQGPGAIHLINGLYDATMDRVPVLALTGQTPNDLLGVQVVQDINQITLFDNCTVYNREARNAANCAHIVPLAIQTAINYGGAAHVSIPCDVLMSKAVARRALPESVYYEKYQIKADLEEVQTAADLINGKDKVAILYGGGTRHAVTELLNLAKKLQAPLIHTTRSKDIIDNSNPYYVGGIGLMGSRAGNDAIKGCDVLISIGSNFAFQEYYPDKAPIIQIEKDPSQLALHVPIAQGLVGDAKLVIKELLPKLTAKDNDSFLKKMQKKHQETMAVLTRYEGKIDDNESPVTPQALTHCVNQHAADDAIFCIDAGLEILWSNTYLHLNGKQRYIWSWHLGSLDCSTGFSIGCQLAAPDKQVIVLTGDGGYDMLIGDFATCIKYNLPITVIVFNNNMYGFIKLVENIDQGYPDFGVDFVNPDYAKVAEAYGGAGYRVTDYNTLNEILPEALNNGKPTIIDVAIDRNALPAPATGIQFLQAYNFLRSDFLNKWRELDL